MDSTLFIRSRRVLTLWLIIPALAAVAVELGSRTFYSYQHDSCMRKQTLDRVIPEMIAAGKQFDQFISGYQISIAGSTSIEDACIELLTDAAAAAKFKVTSINLTQDRQQTPDTVKVAVKVGGTGSCRSIAAFLQNIKKQDPLLYEEKINMTRTVEGLDILQVEAQLGRVYIEKTGILP